MAPGWEHEHPRHEPTEVIPAVPAARFPQEPLQLLDTDHEQHVLHRPRSLFWPIFWGVLLALIVFTFLLTLGWSYLVAEATGQNLSAHLQRYR